MKEDLLQGKISAVLIRYAVPVILSMAATQFYSIADGKRWLIWAVSVSVVGKHLINSGF